MLNSRIASHRPASNISPAAWDRSALICSSVSESIMTRTTLVLLATLHATSALQALVLGGGFAGLYTALNLANGGVKTTLVDERERFAFLPLLYDYACGAADADEISAPFEELCRVPNLTFKRAAVTSIDFDAKSATLDDGTRIDGETLVVALGREAPEAPANARPFYRLEDATFVRETLEGWDGAARDVVVVGGGYTGVELACNLKRKRPADDVTLWDRGDALVPNAAPGNRAAAEKALGAAGVAVKLEAEYDGADADLVVWTAGSRLPPAVRGAPRLPGARDGALAADAGLRVRGATNVRARRLRERCGRRGAAVGADGAAAVRLRGAERARRARGLVDARQLPLRRARRGPDLRRGRGVLRARARAVRPIERRRADGRGRAAAPLRGAHADAVPARRGAQRPGFEGARG